MTQPRIYADFHNADPQGRLRLNCAGTAEDLARQQLTLREGMSLTLYCDDADVDGNADDLEASGVVEYSESERCWVARIDWNAVRNASERRPASGDTKRRERPVVPD